MNAIVPKNGNLDPAIISSLVIGGDLKGLSNEQRIAYYKYRCQQVGLDPSAKPFDLLTLNGKMVLYANAGCTQQLCQIHGLSPTITDRTILDGIYCVTSRVTGKDGRTTENMGAVPVGGLKGDALANAMMKALTKAHRRTILMHCGLGMLDETEVETIPGAQTERRGNPLRADYSSWGLEIDAAKSQEQIDLILGSPEFAEFEKACEEQEARTGMNYAAILRDQADQRKKKLPPRIVRDEHDHNQRGFERPEIDAPNPMKETDGGNPAAEAPPVNEPVTAGPTLSPTAEHCLDKIDLVDDEESLEVAKTFAASKSKELSEAERQIINKAYKAKKLQMRKAA